MPKESTTLIYGTNLSGYRIAYALGKLGYKTVLLNRGSYVDEIKNQVLSQLPLDLCWACGHMPQRMFIGLGAMQVFYNSDILEVNGAAGNFNVKIKKRDPYVNNFICTECEKCIDVCPVDVLVDNETRKACYVHREMAWENIYLIDEAHCTKCGECEKACPTGALKLDRPEETIEINVGAIVLSPEFDEPDENDLAAFGWKKFPNIVKSADLARASLSTNFTQESFVRPSDGNLPKQIAIVITPQFNKKGIEYESYNVSAQAIYRANKIKEIVPEIDVTIFCREYRCFGKGHCRMYERAEKNGVNVIRTQAITINETSDHNISISYQWANSQKEQNFEMAILIFGQKPPQQMEKLKKICGIEANTHGFCKLEPFTCAKTNVPGILAVGEFTAPKGNPETVWEGYGPVREILRHLGDQTIEPPKPPKLRNVSREIPKIGVFICSCFGSFNEKINLENLTNRINSIPRVSKVEIVEGCCTPSTIQSTASKIKESGVNRVILAVCTPLQKLMKFRKTVMMGGLSPLLSEFIRLREDVIQVHDDPQKMESKAFALIHSAASKLKNAQAAPPPMDKMGSTAMIIGGGIAGLESARYLSDMGFQSDIIEKKDNLGGWASIVSKDIEGHEFKPYLEKLLNDIKDSQIINIHTNTTITNVSGYAGNFKVTLNTAASDPFELTPAIVIIATGALENKVDLYSYGKDERIMTQLELSQKMAQVNRGHVAMIQCVDSRIPNRPYCSRICCSQAVHNALLLKEKGIDVTIFYRDLNLYGFKEDYYWQAIEKGIQFIRFDRHKYPKVSGHDDLLELSYMDYETDDELKISADYLVLSVGIVPDRQTNEKLSKMFNLTLDDDGFYDVESCACPYEDASKRLMKPFELSSNGVFPVGLAHSPRSIIESLLMARQAAGKASVVLPKPMLPPPNAMYVSEVDADKCAGCGLCVDVCPYNAREIDPVKKVAIVHPFLCESCGACVVACPSSAAFLRDHREEQMISSIDALLAN
jgi:heterodisulfide reductase subunit A